MKLIIKISLFAVGIGLALLALYGCTPGLGTQRPTLLITTSPSAGHPPFRVAIAAVCSADGGTYTLDTPSAKGITSPTGAFEATVDAYPWQATVTWTDGNTEASKPVVVGLKNKQPVAHNLSLGAAQPQKLEKVTIDLRYRESGCHNGTALQYFGIQDPDYANADNSDANDHFTYRIAVYDETTGKQEMVYTHDGKPLPAGEFSPDPIFYWFPGWSHTYPPFPMSILCDTPTSPPSIGSGDAKIAKKKVHVYVKEFGSEYHWVYEVPTQDTHCSSTQ